jgi:hypothetical protein
VDKGALARELDQAIKAMNIHNLEIVGIFMGNYERRDALAAEAPLIAERIRKAREACEAAGMMPSPKIPTSLTFQKGS